MKTIKAGRALVDFTTLCYAAKQPFLVVGRHGVGKSMIIEQAAQEMKIGYICRDLSLMEPPDLTGLPKLDGEVTRFYPPSFLPTSGQGLLVFEELNRCPSYMRAPTLQLLTARCLNDYKLPAGWLPAAAINPADAAYEVDEMDAALLSRFDQVTIEPDHQEWLEWAQRSGIHPAVRDYVASDPTVFHQPESNPRAWVGVSRLLYAVARSSASRETVCAAIAGLVGDTRAAAFLKQWHDGVRALPPEAIFAYADHRPQVQAWVKGGQLDLVRATLLDLKKRLQPQRNYEQARLNTTTWKNLGLFLADLPGDLRAETETFFIERSYNVPGTKKRRRA